MDSARSIVYALCIIVGMAGGQLWHEHQSLVIIGGIVWFFLLSVFFGYINWRESKGNYFGRHRR